MAANDDFGPCEVCDHRNWSIVYEGPVRDGKFGHYRERARVAQCTNCNVQRLAESSCVTPEIYEDWQYRQKLEQPPDIQEHLAQHDPFQQRFLAHVMDCSPRGRVVADIGCAGGAFLDHVRGIAAVTIGIEPNVAFHASLRERGIKVFPYAKHVAPPLIGNVDLAVSFQVIEHTASPRQFLDEIRPLLKPGGKVLVTTPNRRDILMELLSGDFSKFFYRVVHRWYFDARSLEYCAMTAGFKVESISFIHSYGLSNTLGWLRDRTPPGWKRLSGIDAEMDAMWKVSLETRGRSDILMVCLSVA